MRSGDPDNIEGQAARIYWKQLFGSDFTRDTTQNGKNAFLNYGYAIMRASVARAIVSAGLNPTFSIHHNNQYNALALTDDLIEPLRPRVDVHIYNIVSKHSTAELTTEIKHLILEVLTQETLINEQVYCLFDGIAKYAVSFKDSLEKSDTTPLVIPKLCL